MNELYFLPNTPTLSNAGLPRKTFSACFVLPIEDSLESIYDTLKRDAIIFKCGGGVGHNISALRPKGAPLSGGGESSGAISFMHVFDASSKSVAQGGRSRRSATMMIMNNGHFDIFDFIDAKKEDGHLTSMNLSVGLNDAFMRKVFTDEDWELRYNNERKVIKAKDLFNHIALRAWESGEPGVVFLDTMERGNTCYELAKIKATNPCAEQPLRPNESCNLGSINLDKLVVNGEFDFKLFRKIIHIAVRFLDSIIDINYYPDPIIEYYTKQTRPIGLGIMGYADALIKLKMRYGSKEAIDFLTNICKILRLESIDASIELGREKGNFPAIKYSIYKNIYQYIRNANTTSIAPTGSLSILADCSPGIEPLMSVAKRERMISGYENPVIEHSKWSSFISDPDVAPYIVTGAGVPVEGHIYTMAAAQAWIDAGISKTILLPTEATIDDVKHAIYTAWESGVKGVTVFRQDNDVRQAMFKELCPIHEELLVKNGRCYECPVCGWSDKCIL